MSLHWNGSALLNASFVFIAIYLSIWNLNLHYVWDIAFWVLEGIIIAAFVRTSAGWKGTILFYAFYLLLRASTPPISNLIGRDLRILPLGGMLLRSAK